METHPQKEGYVKTTSGEMAICKPRKVQDCQQTPEARIGKGGVSPRESERTRPCQHLDCGLLASRTEIINFCFKLPSFWYFQTVALVN